MSEFFTRYFGIGKYLHIRFSRFQHRGGYFKLCFLSGNLFDQCDVRHVYLLRTVSASFLSKTFLELSKFFGGYLSAEKNSFIRISQLEHSGRYFNSGCPSGFFSGNLFDRCDIRHVYLLLCRHCAYCSDEFVSCLDAGEGDDPVDEVEECLEFLGRIAFCYSKAQRRAILKSFFVSSSLRSTLSARLADWRVPLQGRRAPGSSRSSAGRACVSRISHVDLNDRVFFEAGDNVSYLP